MARSRTELDPAFRRLIKQLPDAVTAAIHVEIAASTDAVYAGAQAEVPVDIGDLKAAMGKRVTRGGNAGEVGYSRAAFGARKWKLAGWRAKFILLGTKGYTRKPKRGPASRASAPASMPARPANNFLLRAFLAQQPGIIERHRRAIGRVVREIAGS